MERGEVMEFVELAKKYCNLVESLASSNVLDELTNIASSLSELYSKALKLPQVESDSIDIPEVTVSRPKISFDKYECYWEIFEPYKLEKATCSNLSDDILDIYQDIKKGLLLYEGNEKGEAIWHWHFHFYTHWGNHIVDALRALHSIIQNHQFDVD